VWTEALVRYRGQRPDDATLRSRIRELVAERRRFCYRRLHVLLRGRVSSSTASERSASTARRGSWCGVGGVANGPPARERRFVVAASPNARWSIDFIHDQIACGRRFRILNILHEFTKVCLVAIADSSNTDGGSVGNVPCTPCCQLAGPAGAEQHGR
jgi:putative transposase